MPLTINFDLSDEDLKHFGSVVESAREASAGLTDAQVIEAAEDLLSKAQQSNTPKFVTERLELVGTLVAMMRDVAWALSAEDCANVRSALAYFAHGADVIPDTVPVLGFIDDAIMIELCARDLRHEIEAY